jgi:hypothetical protein
MGGLATKRAITGGGKKEADDILRIVAFDKPEWLVVAILCFFVWCS